MPPETDEFGQTLRDDWRYMWRFRTLTRRTIDWRKPSPAEAAEWDDHPFFGDFADYTIALTTLDERIMVVRERFWSGWPDPPNYVLFACEADGTIWCARDFGFWPRRWTIAGARPR